MINWGLITWLKARETNMKIVPWDQGSTDTTRVNNSMQAFYVDRISVAFALQNIYHLYPVYKTIST